MTRVNSRELDAIRKVYPNVQTKHTRHNLYIINAYGAELRAYMEVARGQLSRRQQKSLYWNERTRRQRR